jgi:hypothetical protein
MFMQLRLPKRSVLLLAAALCLPAQAQRAPVVAWVGDTEVLIGAGGLLARFDLATGEEELLGETEATFALSPEGKRLALARGRWIELRSYPGLDLQGRLEPPAGLTVGVLAWSPEGATLAAGTAEGHILLWAVEAEELWADLAIEPASPVERLAFSADGVRLLSAFADGRAVLWDIERRKALHRFDLPRTVDGQPDTSAQNVVVDLSPDGRHVLATQVRESEAEDGAGGEAEVLLLDDRGQLRWRRSGYGVEFTRDGAALLALVPPFRIAGLYRTSDAEALRVFEPPEEVLVLYLVRQSPNGKFLLGVGEDHQGQVLVLWDFATAQVLETHR